MGDKDHKEPKEFDIDDLAQAAALPVAESSNCDPCAPPPSGPQYLLRVKLEGKKLPDYIVRVPERKGKFKHIHKIHAPKTRTVNQFLLERFVKADVEICPTVAWADESLKSFKRVRDKVNEARTLANNPLCDRNLTKVPHIRNAPAWRKLILGEKETPAQGQKKEDNLDGVIYRSKDGKGPLLAVIIQFPQVAVIDFIESITSWVKEVGWSHQASVWLYSLLACLELPVVGDTVAILRDLSRTCSSIRVKHKRFNDQSIVTSLNLIICIVGQFFGQLDICDDFITKETVPSPSTSKETQDVPKDQEKESNEQTLSPEAKIKQLEERLRSLQTELSLETSKPS